MIFISLFAWPTLFQIFNFNIEIQQKYSEIKIRNVNDVLSGKQIVERNITCVVYKSLRLQKEKEENHLQLCESQFGVKRVYIFGL